MPKPITLRTLASAISGYQPPYSEAQFLKLLATEEKLFNSIRPRTPSALIIRAYRTAYPSSTPSEATIACAHFWTPAPVYLVNYGSRWIKTNPPQLHKHPNYRSLITLDTIDPIDSILSRLNDVP